MAELHGLYIGVTNYLLSGVILPVPPGLLSKLYVRPECSPFGRTQWTIWGPSRRGKVVPKPPIYHYYLIQVVDKDGRLTNSPSIFSTMDRFFFENKTRRWPTWLTMNLSMNLSTCRCDLCVFYVGQICHYGPTWKDEHAEKKSSLMFLRLQL